MHKSGLSCNSNSKYDYIECPIKYALDLIISDSFVTSKHVHSSTQVHLFLFFLLFLLLLFGISISAASSAAARSSKLRRICEILLVDISFIKGVVVASKCDSQYSLEGIRDRVRNTGLSWVSQSKG